MPLLPAVQLEAEDHLVARLIPVRGGGEQPTVELYVDPGALNSSRGERPRLAFDRPLDGVWASDDFGVVVLVEVGNGA